MSRRRDLAEQFAREFDIPLACDSLVEMLSQADINAVYISSTNQLHHPQVMAAAAAGKHVLCEKPLATTLADAVEMVAACQRAGVIMGTNHHLRNAVTIRAIRDLIASGRIGTPVAVLASQPCHVEAQVWRRNNVAEGAGVAFDVLVHSADTVRFVLGREPVRVCAMGNSSPAMAAGVNDSILATYRFDGGVLAQLYADFNVPCGRTRLDIHGTEGSIFGHDVLGKTPAHRGRVVLRDRGGEMEVALESDASRYLRMIDIFNDSIQGKAAPVCTGVDGVRSLAMILAAEEAARSGESVAVSTAGLDLLH